MKNFFKGKKTAMFSIAIAITMCFATVIYAAGGSETDPVISKSYLDKIVKEVYTYIDQKVAGIGGGGASTFTVVEVAKGKTFIADEGTEFIMRSGSATAITASLGGLSDVTNGSDIANKEKIPQYHMLICPRDDGRGLLATSNLYMMVKGGYTLK